MAPVNQTSVEPESYFFDILTTLFFVLFEVVGNFLLVCVIIYEKNGMDPQKRTVTNRLLSGLCLATIVFNLGILPFRFLFRVWHIEIPFLSGLWTYAGQVGFILFVICTILELAIIKFLYVFAYSRISSLDEYFLSFVLEFINIVFIIIVLGTRIVSGDHERNPIATSIDPLKNSDDIHQSIRIWTVWIPLAICFLCSIGTCLSVSIKKCKMNAQVATIPQSNIKVSQIEVSVISRQPNEVVQSQNEEVQNQNDEVQNQNEEVQSQNGEVQNQKEEVQSHKEEVQSPDEEVHIPNEEAQHENEKVHNKNEEVQKKNEEVQSPDEDVHSPNKVVQNQNNENNPPQEVVNNVSHNDNLINLSGIVVLSILLCFLFLFFILKQHFRLEIPNTLLITYCCICIGLPSLYFQRNPLHLTSAIEDIKNILSNV